MNKLAFKMGEATKQKRKKPVFAILMLLMLILIAITGAWAAQIGPFEPQSKKTSTSEDGNTVKPILPSEISSRTLFVGTTYWGRYTNRAAQNSPLKEAFPFSELSTLSRSNYDAWVANLECPLVSSVNLTAEQEEANLSFNCSPKYLTEAKKWFTVFGSSNNHSDNQGAEGLMETRKHLEENDIQYFGSYDPEVLDEVCEVVDLPAKVKMSDDSLKAGFLPVALCGYHGVFKVPSEASLSVMEKYSKFMPVIAYPHSGAEYKAAPDNIKVNLYHSMIDHGADMVIGDHPHWVQNTESYKGKLIVYSMGNFMFDQQFNQEVMRSAAIDVTFSAKFEDESDSKNLEAWLKLADDCKTYQDDCLKQAETQNLNRLPVDYKFAFVATNNSGYKTHLATQAERAALQSRLNWNSTISQLAN